jgi:hypothetical protein
VEVRLRARRVICPCCCGDRRGRRVAGPWKRTLGDHQGVRIPSLTPALASANASGVIVALSGVGLVVASVGGSQRWSLLGVGSYLVLVELVA